MIRPALVSRSKGTVAFVTAVMLCAATALQTASDANEVDVTPVASVEASATIPAAAASNSADASNKSTKNNKQNKTIAPGFTPEREAAAMMFVRTHHPELADLLARLKDRRPSEYQKAVRDLFKASERLAQSQEMRPARYEWELEEWKLASRAQLLVARLTMERTPALEQELRQLLAEQLEVHRKIVASDRDRATARAAQLDVELRRLDNDRQQVLEEKFQQALNLAGEKKQALRAGKKNEAKSDAPAATKVNK